jgi:hypothetical protein
MGRRATGDITTDSTIPEVIEAEERVLKLLRSDYGAKAVTDTRKLRKGYDFTIKSLLKLKKGDVKADFHSLTTQRLAWEGVVKQKDGTSKPGWGLLNLDIVVVVTPDKMGLEAWRYYLCDARAWRNYIEREKPEPTWVSFDMPNTNGVRGRGWAVPIQELRDAGVILKEGYL